MLTIFLLASSLLTYRNFDGEHDHPAVSAITTVDDMTPPVIARWNDIIENGRTAELEDLLTQDAVFYSPAVFSREPDLRASALYVVGGVYGNEHALSAVLAMARQEGAALVFNGDFNWFNADAAGFENVNAAVLMHTTTSRSYAF